MKTKTTLRNSFLSLGLTMALGMSAQTIVVEAESPIESDQVSVATLDAEGSEASGLAGLSMDNAHRGSYAVYAFDAPEAGTYNLDVWYITMNTRWISLKVNDQVANIMKCDILSGGWNGVGGEVITDEQSGASEYRKGVVSKTIPVYCEKGQNFLTVKAIYGYSPEEGRDQRFAPTIDRFELTRATSEISKPRDWDEEADRLTRQCEDYDAVTGKVSTDDRPAFTNKRGTNIGAAGGTVSYNVNVPEEGVYMLEIWYATMQRRWISVKANRQITQYVSFVDFSQGWGNDEGEWYCRRQVLVYLNKGENVITFGQYTKDSGKDTSEHGDSPSLDLFTLDYVLYPDFTEPDREISMYKASLADIAKWSGTIDLSALNDHNEYTVATAEGTTAQIVLEFPTEIAMTAYALATENNVEKWVVETSADKQNWVAADMQSTSVNNDITTIVVSETQPAKYVRLTINGDEPVRIGDFAVFGNPTATMPNSLLPAGFSDYETTHVGFDVADWHEGIDKLFDGDFDTQFTVAQDGDGGMGDADDIRITVYLPRETEVKAYSLSTHHSSFLDRAPNAWTLEAFDYEADNGDGNYVTIDSRSGMNFVTSASTIAGNVASPILSDCYVLTLKNRRNRATHLSDFQLYGEPFNTGITGVETIDEVKAIVTMWGENGAVAINAANEAAYTIVSVSGMTVATGNTLGESVTRVNLPAGLYIVTVDGRSAKVIVK